MKKQSRRKQQSVHKSIVAVEERSDSVIGRGVVRCVGDGVGHKTDVASPQWCSTHMRRRGESVPRGGLKLNSLSTSSSRRHRIVELSRAARIRIHMRRGAESVP